MGKVLDFILNRKSPESVLFDVAVTAMDRLAQKIKIRTNGKEEDWVIESNIWKSIVPGDPSSPKIMGISGNSSMIYYPKFSTPYRHNLIDKCKFATVLSGEIHDETTGMVFSPKKSSDGKPYCAKIYPEDNFMPHTKGTECYVLVVIDDCDKTLDEVCL